MNNSQIRSLVTGYITDWGGMSTSKFPRGLIDRHINTEMQSHFKRTMSQHGYWHTRVTAYQDEYLLADSIYSPYYVAISGQRYLPAQYPMAENVTEYATSMRTRILEDGTEVYSEDNRLYWILGRTIKLFPKPYENTGTEITGSCTISGSTITTSSGSLSTDNTYKDYLVRIGDTDYIILSHDDTDIVVDGIPDDTETTYTIAKLGLQIRGVEIPTSPTSGSDDEIPGTDTDADCIALKVAIKCIASDNRKDEQKMVALRELRGLHKDALAECIRDQHHTHSRPISILPFNLR